MAGLEGRERGEGRTGEKTRADLSVVRQAAAMYVLLCVAARGDAIQHASNRTIEWGRSDVLKYMSKLVWQSLARDDTVFVLYDTAVTW